MRERRGRGRPRAFDERTALENAMLTFWQNGYAGTSLDDLVETTGASRASLYSTFGDKRAMFLKALELYGDRFEDRVRAFMDEETDVRTVVANILESSAKRLTKGPGPAGCLRCNATLELMGTEARMDDELAAANNRYQQTVQAILEAGARRKQLTENNVVGLARFITGSVNGMVTLSRAGATHDDLREFIACVMRAWPAATLRFAGNEP